MRTMNKARIRLFKVYIVPDSVLSGADTLLKVCRTGQKNYIIYFLGRLYKYGSELLTIHIKQPDQAAACPG